MRKLLLVGLALVLLIATTLTIAAPASACGGGTDYSPGYWKNHLPWPGGYEPTDTWFSAFGNNDFDGTLMEALKARGHGSYIYRYAVANLLNNA